MTAELIAALEAAEGPSRELDDVIATAIFTDKRRTCIKGLSDEAGGMWMFRYPDGSIGSSLRFTASIDAAMMLVPEGWAVERAGWHNLANPSAYFELWEYTQLDNGGWFHISDNRRAQGEASTPANALVIAALRAKGDV